MSDDLFRIRTRQLTESDLKNMKAIKTKASDLLTLIENVSNDPRSAALARTKLQEVVFFGVHALTAEPATKEGATP